MLRGLYHKKEKEDVSLLSPIDTQNKPKDNLKIIEQIKLFYFDKKSQSFCDALEVAST